MPTAISWGNFQILWWQSPHWSRKLSSSPMNICQLWLQCSKCAWELFSEPRPEPPRTSHLHRTERCQWSWSLILIRLRRTRRNPTCTWMYICIWPGIFPQCPLYLGTHHQQHTLRSPLETLWGLCCPTESISSSSWGPHCASPASMLEEVETFYWTSQMWLLSTNEEINIS